MNKVWKKLITELLDKNITFDLVNNVLSFEGLPDDVRGLWLWFGEVRIAHEDEKTAGEMLILTGFDFNERDELIMFTRGVEE